MEKNDIIELKIEDMLDDGRGFGRIDGCAVFVDGGVLGDVVHAKVSKVKKNTVEARSLSISRPSEHRIEAECPYASECGGCSLQELDYGAQLELKKQQVVSKLTRLGGIENPKIAGVIGADSLKYYRNKATFAVGPHGEVGFLKGKSHYVMDIVDCMLQTDAAMVCADALRTFLKNRLDNKGLTGQYGCIRQMIVKTAFSTGEVMVSFESEKKEIPHIEELVEMIDAGIFFLSHDDEGEPLEGVMEYVLKSVNIICNNKCHCIAGLPTILEEVITDEGKTLKFEISPQSFYQVNPEQMVRLYSRAVEYANLSGKETVLDLYCGVGTIGIFMADQAEKVIGIETCKPAVLDANRNSVINGIINTRYFAGKAEEELPGMMGLAKLYKYNEVNEVVERTPEITIDHVDVAVVDPPRAGCDEALLNALVVSKAERIVYVSCDPGTLARDIKYLTANGYEFKECTIVDQFPWTNHVEVACKLVKK